MLKKVIIGILITSFTHSQNFVVDFFKYSTVYGGFNLTSPKFEEDRYRLAVIDPVTGIENYLNGGVSIVREDMELKPDFDLSFGIRKVGRFQYEPKRGVKNAGVGGDWYKGTETNFNEAATIGKVRGWEYLIKYSENQRWDEKFKSQEYFLRYLGDLFIAKVKYANFELEDIQYGQGDIRFRKEFTSDEASLNFSIGVGGRTHPAYGFAPTVVDSSWYLGSWWEFASDAFGIDDRGYAVDTNGDGIGDGLDDGLALYDVGNGQLIGYVNQDYRWFNEDGKLMAMSDREFYQYHFPRLLENWFEDKTRALGNQREISLSLGVDYYRYSENFWIHVWGSLYPYHYGLDKYSYHNAVRWQSHDEDGLEPQDFVFEDAGIGQWLDYDLGAIIGFKLKENLCFYSEGKYLNYWERPAYELKVGLNYQFLGL